MHSAKKLKIMRPANRTNANSVFDSVPPGQRALNTTLKTNVYTSNMKIGLKKDHNNPKAEPR